MEPLFLDSPMHEKIWGGNRLKTEFGYDISSEHTGEYWAISAHPNGVSYVKNGKYAGFHLAELYKDKPELFGHPKASVFPLLTKILMLMIGCQCRYTQTMPMVWSMKVN